MRIIRSDVLGMCFGVRDALKILDGIDRPQDVTIHGELVHNEQVLVQLDLRGFQQKSERDRGAIPDSPTVLITAHGISDAERNRLETAGKTLVDTTCPLVTRVHRAARALHDQGHFVVVIGKPGHVEVQGIIEDLDRCEVVGSVSDAKRYPSSRLGVVCQTTTPPERAKAIRIAIEKANPDAEVRFVDTVCRPTKEHQRALDRMLLQVDCVVVVGGRNSNNTRELVETSRSRGVPAHHVQGPEDLDPSWFVGVGVVGLTAGTSTLDAMILDVQHALETIGQAQTPSRSRLLAAGR